MSADGELTCAINLEWLNAQGITQRKINHKSATLRLIRNNCKDMYVEVSAAKSAPVKLLLKSMTVHNKFMNEGKASIKFPEVKCSLFLSNAPPDQLFSFLRTIFVKMSNANKPDSLNKSLRTQVLTGKPNQFEEISPVTASEVDQAKAKMSKTSETTPSPNSRKRKLESTTKDKDGQSKGPASKKLYSSSPIPTEPLDIEQKEVLDACLAGQNVFFTGSAGTGKSYLLRRIIGALPPTVTVATASTGVAACHIGGITFHQFAGIGKGEATLENSIKMASKGTNGALMKKCKHLIIDEISMIDGDFFEKVEAVARNIRRTDKPFGGIQLILCGDFFQLPPVTKGTAKVKFCFQTKSWENCKLAFYELMRVHRQTDEEFISILNQVRLGRIPDDMAQKLADTAKQKIESKGILATRLCTHTQDANIINESKLKALQGDVKVFTAEDSSPHARKQLDQQTPVPAQLELKVGAQVMLLKNINISTGLVNGARGVIKSFRDGLPVVQFRNVEYVAKLERFTIKTEGGMIHSRKQVPLKLAWAFSIHKSQGLTLDCVEMSLGRVFEAGQAYVALSRAQSLNTLRVLEFKQSQVWANPDVVEFHRNLTQMMDHMRLIPLGRKEENGRTNKGANSGGRSGLMKSLKSLKSMNKPLVNIC